MNDEAFALYTDTMMDAAAAQDGAKTGEYFRRAAKAAGGNLKAKEFLQAKLASIYEFHDTFEFQEPFLKAVHGAFKEYFPKDPQLAIESAELVAELYFLEESYADEAVWRREVIDLLSKSRVDNRATAIAKARYHLVMALDEGADSAAAEKELANLKAHGAHLLTAEERAALLETEGDIALKAKRLDEAFDRFTAAMELFADLGQPGPEARLLLELSHIRSEQGRGAEAAQLMARFAETSHRAKILGLQGEIEFGTQEAKWLEREGLLDDAAEQRRAVARAAKELAALEKGPGDLHHLPPGVTPPKDSE